MITRPITAAGTWDKKTKNDVAKIFDWQINLAEQPGIHYICKEFVWRVWGGGEGGEKQQADDHFTAQVRMRNFRISASMYCKASFFAVSYRCYLLFI